MCNAIAVTYVALLYDPYWDRDVPAWGGIIVQKTLKSTATARVTDLRKLPTTLAKLHYDTAKFVMAMSAGDGKLMAKMTSPAVCNPKTRMLAVGVAWWIVSVPQTVNATRCGQLVGWLHGKIRVDASTAMYRHLDEAYSKLSGGSSYTAAAPTLKYPFGPLAIWNSVLVASHALGSLFANSVYPNNPNFKGQLLSAMKVACLLLQSPSAMLPLTIVFLLRATGDTLPWCRRECLF